MTVLQAIEDITSVKAGSDRLPSFVLSIEVARLTGMTLLTYVRNRENDKRLRKLRKRFADIGPEASVQRDDDGPDGSD